MNEIKEERHDVHCKNSNLDLQTFVNANEVV